MSDASLSFWDHVEELRQTLIKVIAVIFTGMLLSLAFYQQIFEWLTLPYQTLGGGHNGLIILDPAEGLSSVMKMSFWVGLVGTSPFWLYFVLGFVAPALRKNEKTVLIPFFLLSLLFLAFGFLFSLYFTIPLANQYLESINQTLGVSYWTLSHYLNYTVVLLFANALAFESCVILFFLVHFRWIRVKAMQANRRIVIVGIFILSAILTPPDVFSQLLLAIPLILVYESAIIYAKFRARRIN